MSNIVIGAPIHDAVSSKDIRFVIDLLKSNPKGVNLINEKGQTPILIAAAINSEDIAKILLEKGIVDKGTINKKDQAGLAPIHYTIMNRNPKLAQLLIDHGASLTVATEEEGFTPLHVIANQIPEDDVIISFFLEHAHVADFKYRDKQGRTPRDIARQRERFELANRFDRYEIESEVREAQLIYDMIDAIRKREIELVKGFIKADKRLINTQDKYGYSPLMAAAQTGNLALVKLLLKNGAKPDLNDMFGRTAFYYARYQPDKKIEIELSRAGALPSAADKRGVLPSPLKEGTKEFNERINVRRRLDNISKKIETVEKLGRILLPLSEQERAQYAVGSKELHELKQRTSLLKSTLQELVKQNAWLVDFGGTSSMPKEVVEKKQRLKEIREKLENLESSIEGLSFYKKFTEAMKKLRIKTLEANEDPKAKAVGEEYPYNYSPEKAGGMLYLTRYFADKKDLAIAYNLVTRSSFQQLINEMIEVINLLQTRFGELFPAESTVA